MVPKIGILITNYKAWPVTEQSVAAALQHGGESVGSILVVDDCSDAPEHWAGDSRVRIHRNATNRGYARSVNIGMALMQEDLVVLLDCDARLLTPFAPAVQAAFAGDAKLAALGFAQTDDTGIIRQSGEPCPFAMEFVIGPAFWNRLPKAVRGVLSPAKSFLCIHSCCMALRRSAFNEIGGFDDSFDFLDADMDFSVCLNQAGWRTALTSEVLCFHPGGGSPQSTTTRVLRLHRNRWRLLLKHELVSVKSVFRLLLAVRHGVEWGVLWLQLCLSGEKNHDLREKMLCRQQLLASVWFDYQKPRTSNTNQ